MTVWLPVSGHPLGAPSKCGFTMGPIMGARGCHTCLGRVIREFLPDQGTEMVEQRGRFPRSESLSMEEEKLGPPHFRVS